MILRALAKRPDDRYAGWDEFAQALSALIANREVPRGQLQGVLDSERFTLLRSLEFFSSFGDVELWEVVHRASWQRFGFGHALYRKGEEGRSFHIVAQGEVEVFRDGKQVAQLGAGTSVGEMAYLAPSPELRRHSADVIVSKPCTTISFTPETLAQVGPGCRHLFDEAFIRRAGAAAARRPRGARPSAADSLRPALRSAQRSRTALASSACRADGAERAGSVQPHPHRRPHEETVPRHRPRRSPRSPAQAQATSARPRPPRRSSPAPPRRASSRSARQDAGAGGAAATCEAQADREEARRRGEDELLEEVRGRRRRAAARAATCEAQAAEKKLAGAAKTSFVKKCVADARAK